MVENINKLLIIGPKLQYHGIGGVSIHVQRLLDFLDKIVFPYTFIDYKKTCFTTLIKTINSAKMVHIHISNPSYQLCIVVLCILLRKKVVVTLHGNYGRFGWLNNYLVRMVIKFSTVPIIINEKSFEICKQFNKDAVFIPAFIPPQKEELLHPDLNKLLSHLKTEGKTIVSTNASNRSYDKNGDDIYGIDFLVQYFKSHANYSLLISDPSGNYKKHYSDLQSKSIFFLDYPHSFFELLKHVDYFVRNTSTDGDALSVKESLYLGVPTLCTDVVNRPKGVRLFMYCDVLSFEKALNTPAEGNARIENGAEMIVNVYRRLTD